MMRILHINFNFLKSSLYKELSRSLMANSCNNEVLFPTLINEECTVNEKFIIKAEILNKYDRYLFKYRANKILKYIKKNLDINSYSITHAHSLFSNGYISYLLKKEYSIPYIVAVRNTDLNRFFRKRILLRRLGVDILINADKIIFLSEPYREQTVEGYVPIDKRQEINKKSVIIPNGINEFWHKNILQQHKSKPNNKIKVLSVGVVSKKKNILTSIEACQLLIKKGIEVQLTVIGEVRDYSVLEKMKKYEFVTYIPKVSKEVLLSYYRESDLFLMPSITETFGLVYAEAMSQGLPVLYSKGQGFDEQFPDGTVGYAVEKMDSYDIAEKILLTLESYQEISKKCIDSVSKFDWDKISKKYIEIYTEILQ